MIARFLAARRRAKALRDLDKRIAAMRLGMTTYEEQEDARRRHASNALLLGLLAIAGAGILFGMLDPIFESLDHLLKALQ
jgi:Mg2+/citrate symporter